MADVEKENSATGKLRYRRRSSGLASERGGAQNRRRREYKEKTR